MLKPSFQKIVNQLRELPPNARLLIGSLMVILVMTLILVGTLAGSTRMVPLNVGGARAEVVKYLDGYGVEYRDDGDRLLVPAERSVSILARLTEDGVVKGDDIDFNSLIQDDSPFRSTDERRKRWLVAKMNVLSGTIGQWTDIKRARVVIDAPEGRPGIGKAHVRPTASVTVWTGGTSLGQKTVDAISHFVAGSHPGLAASSVQVVDASGQRYTTRDDDSMSTHQALEIKKNTEGHVRQSIEQLLAYIPGVIVEVNATPEVRYQETKRHEIDEPLLGPLEQTSRTMSSSSEDGASGAGVRPNTGVSVAGGGRRQQTTADEQTTKRTKPVFPGAETAIVDPGGYALRVNAAVSVPRSYLINIYKADAADPDADPDPTLLAQLETDEITRITAQIEPLVDTAAVENASVGSINVSFVHDYAMTAADAAEAGMGGGVTSLLGESMVKNVGLTGLALVSLAMMFLMVRKANVREELPTAEEIVGIPPMLEGDDSEIAGEAREAPAMMLGLEVDDAELRRVEILGQINELIKNEPANTAGLMRRWVNAPR